MPQNAAFGARGGGANKYQICEHGIDRVPAHLALWLFQVFKNRSRRGPSDIPGRQEAFFPRQAQVCPRCCRFRAKSDGSCPELGQNRAGCGPHSARHQLKSSSFERERPTYRDLKHTAPRTVAPALTCGTHPRFGQARPNVVGPRLPEERLNNCWTSSDDAGAPGGTWRDVGHALCRSLSRAAASITQSRGGPPPSAKLGVDLGNSGWIRWGAGNAQARTELPGPIGKRGTNTSAGGQLLRRSGGKSVGLRWGGHLRGITEDDPNLVKQAVGRFLARPELRILMPRDAADSFRGQILCAGAQELTYCASIVM